MFSYNNGKKMGKYRPSANQKYVNAATLKSQIAIICWANAGILSTVLWPDVDK